MRTVPKPSLTPSTERRRHRFASVFSCSGLVLLGLVLAGCSSDDTNHNASARDATVPDEENQTATSQDPSPTEYIPASEDGPAQNVPVPEKPEGLSELTEEGMKAAALYWWDAYNYMSESGDTALLEEISTESCEYCQGQMDSLIRHYEEGAWSDNSGTEPEIYNVLHFDPDSGQGEVDVSVTQHENHTYDSNGEIIPGRGVEDYQRTGHKMDLAFDESEEIWQIVQIWYYSGGVAE
ncbi:DUF6318 family protein [Auritidibacter ignavus]|uniref:DUF6318 family protein n=1 Tax=Auritidibacter ignavus TaxID=678932 RepID=UPI00244ACC55|nr:DUF6318 family protein [Auritidibacter ignavus]WGH89696.1 DUF6318 family protein [Auritidibacter ignavus]